MFCSNDVRIKLTLMIQNIIIYNYWLHASPDCFLYPIRYDIVNTYSIIPDGVLKMSLI